MNGTNGYAGAGGTNAQCQVVINALDTPYTYAVSDTNPPGSTPSGCGKVNITGGERRRYLGNPTTGSATLSSFQRACACNFTCGGSYTISSNQVNLNLFSYAGSPSCTGGSYTFTISPGVTVYSNNTAMPALTTGTWPSGTTLTLVNGGSIIGMGGAGGSGNITPAWSGNPGYPGGDAVSVTTNVTITNNGMIAGGGGGGGGGAQTVQRFGQQGAGGGGGQSFSSSAGGGGVNISGAGGTQSSGGNGGGYFDPYGIGGAAGVNGTTGNAIGTYVCGGGGGGGYGAYGGTGATHGQVPGAGGAPGKAVNANGNTIIWLATGTRYGALQ
jgi:hypothetical protein